jgi:hypothetical protein
VSEEIKAQWVAALRSGEYKQGKWRLRLDASPATGKPWADGKPRYCCLGVLCELAVAAGIIERAPVGYWASSDHLAKISSVLPLAVAEWAGLRNGGLMTDPYIPTELLPLSCINDGSGPTGKGSRRFPAIATLIEEQL